MDEQSHKEEMRAALRGDFERLRARRGDAAPALPEPVAAPVAAPPPQGAADPPAGAPEPRGRFARLLGRS